MGTGLVQRCDKAAASPGKGFGETFTINRLGPPTSLRRCLGTTNLVESPSVGRRLRMRRVTRLQPGQVILRWVAYLGTEKHFRGRMERRRIGIS
ncbi:MAG: hypothetical protein E3J25_07780 [Anaerolineales bacterium]|nr:MAG: hypothetical protein E3J25_07780 [Anaerolineales bacterium]